MSGTPEKKVMGEENEGCVGGLVSDLDRLNFEGKNGEVVIEMESSASMAEEIDEEKQKVLDLGTVGGCGVGDCLDVGGKDGTGNQGREGKVTPGPSGAGRRGGKDTAGPSGAGRRGRKVTADGPNVAAEREDVMGAVGGECGGGEVGFGQDLVDPDVGEDRKDATGEIIARNLSGLVQMYNVQKGYGFIRRADKKPDIFVHQTAILRRSATKLFKSLGEGEEVVFDEKIGKKGVEAINVQRLDGQPVIGSAYVPQKRRGAYGSRSFVARNRLRSRGGPAESESSEGTEESISAHQAVEKQLYGNENGGFLDKYVPRRPREESDPVKVRLTKSEPLVGESSDVKPGNVSWGGHGRGGRRRRR